MKIPIIPQTYEAGSAVLSGQRVVNMMIETAPANGLSDIVLIPVPGEKKALTVGDMTSMDRCRGFGILGNFFYAVYGTTLYRILSNGSYVGVGTVLGTERVIMAANSVQLVIVADNNTYWYSTFTDSFGEMTHANFLTASSVAYLNGYFIFTQKGTNQFFWSPLNDDITGESDFDNFDATARARAATSVGNCIAVVADHRELWFFKEDAFAEVWQISDDANLPFSPLAGASVQRGALSKYAIKIVDKTLMLVGDDGVVYKANGYSLERVSNYAIELQIAKMATNTDVFTAQWYEGGHKLFGMWYPTAKKAFIYDTTLNEWHERESKGGTLWRVNDVINIYGRIYVGDSKENTLGELDFNTYQEYEQTKSSYLVGPTLHAEGAGFSLDRIEVLCENGLGNDLVADPKVSLLISKDFGRTFGTPKTRSLGKIGEYQSRSVWRQQGHHKQATLMLRFTNAATRIVVDAYAEISPRRI